MEEQPSVGSSVETPPSRRIRATDWVKRHKLLSITFLGVAILLIDIVTLPFGEIEELRHRNPTETAFMREHKERMKTMGKSPSIMHQWVPISRISQDLINAVIVAEDASFWSHEGFDWFELKESIEKNISEGRAARGASTITQQLVKNLYLSPSKNPVRKLREWILTWWMERTLSKRRILELYLNLIEWGDGIYGAEMAARTYYGKSAAELTKEEAARMAAVIPNPRRRRPDGESRYVQRRAELILSRMAARGL